MLLPEKYVYSSYDISKSNKYGIPLTKTISFSQNVDEELYKNSTGELDVEVYNAALISDLRSQATKYISENEVPKINYTLKANIDKVTDVGDTILVYDERFDVEILTQIIKVKYDCIKQDYVEIEFGNFKKKLSNLTDQIVSGVNENIKNESQNISVKFGKDLESATNKILNLLGDSNCIFDGNQLLFLDNLPKELAKYVIRINAAGIGFSQNGINGPFNSAWTIDGVMDMQNINVINFVADMIKGGTFKLGGLNNESGKLELYDESGKLLGVLDKSGFKMFAIDKSYVLLNAELGFVGYDMNGNKSFWADKDEFHMRKSVVEEEVLLCNKMIFLPITIKNEEGKIINDGIGTVAVVGGV